jgi:hypothetical protein
MVNSF